MRQARVREEGLRLVVSRDAPQEPEEERAWCSVLLLRGLALLYVYVCACETLSRLGLCLWFVVSLV